MKMLTILNLASRDQSLKLAHIYLVEDTSSICSSGKWESGLEGL